MKVGILGNGVVGQTLGKGLASKGHDVKIGTRSPEKPELREWVKSARGKGSVGTFAEAAAFGEMLVLAALGQAAEEVVRLAGERSFDGKLLIDTTNPWISRRGCLRDSSWA